MKRKVKLNLFNLLVLVTAIISFYCIVHDFIILGIIPLFTKNLVSLTYTGVIIETNSLLFISYYCLHP